MSAQRPVSEPLPPTGLAADASKSRQPDSSIASAGSGGTPDRRLSVHVRIADECDVRVGEYAGLFAMSGEKSLSRHPAWLAILQNALRHVPHCIEGHWEGKLRAILPLVAVRSRLFGSFLVSLPYLNTGGVIACRSCSDEERGALSRALTDEAIALAESYDVRFLELRNERPQSHTQLTETLSNKVHMRLPLTASADELWSHLSAKVRNQVRKGQKHNLTVNWGRAELLRDFYVVFSRNMRDLGTPVYGRALFEQILLQFPEQAELCVVRSEGLPLAVALLLHGDGTSEVPSASSLREHNSSNANMLMYWHLLERSIQRGQQTFDFGRSSPDSGTYRFKEQWGAQPVAASWQYYLRRGTQQDMRPENSKYRRLIRLWQRLPVPITRWIGPAIVRGIP